MSKDFVLMRKKQPVLIRWQYSRVIAKNQNALVCVTGSPGSGKTYAAIRLAEQSALMNGVEFNVDYIVFTPHEFMKLLNSGRLRKGSIIILDEAGVAINSRKWQSAVNLMMNYIMQTFRHKNYMVIMNVPYFDFIDAAVRKLFHLVMDMDRIDYKNCIAWGRPKLIQINQRTGYSYYKWIRYKSVGEQPKALDQAGFRLPDKDLLIAYEQKKKAYTSNLNLTLEKDLDEQENGVSKELTELQKKTLKLRNDFGLKEEDIGRVLGVVQSTVNEHLKACKKKGHIVNRAKRNQEKMKESDIESIKEALKKEFQDLKGDNAK